MGGACSTLTWPSKYRNRNRSSCLAAKCPCGLIRTAHHESAEQCRSNPPLATDNLLENAGGVLQPPSVFSRGGSLLPVLYADARATLTPSLFHRPPYHTEVGGALYNRSRDAEFGRSLGGMIWSVAVHTPPPHPACSSVGRRPCRVYTSAPPQAHRISRGEMRCVSLTRNARCPLSNLSFMPPFVCVVPVCLRCPRYNLPFGKWCGVWGG